MKNASKYFAILVAIGVFAYLMQETEYYREFNFKYNVVLEPSDTKVRVWIPIPQTNEVQTVSNLSLSNKDKMNCTELTEKNHKNKYQSYFLFLLAYHHLYMKNRYSRIFESRN